jgi:hypothetical protein
MKKQAEAVSHIKELLSKRGLSITPRKMTLEDSQEWSVFEYRGREIGIDSVSGIWVRRSISDDWRCLAMPCSVSGALQAVEFLTQD